MSRSRSDEARMRVLARTRRHPGRLAAAVCRELGTDRIPPKIAVGPWSRHRASESWPVAEAIADRVDWPEVAELVQRGCPAALAGTILD